MKLTREQRKKTAAVEALLKKDKLTSTEKEQIFNDYNEGVLGDVSANSAFFTGVDLSYDFTYLVPVHGIVVDLASGFGCLSYTALQRDYYEHKIDKIILIERNKPYLDVSKKLVEPIERTYYEGGEEKIHRTEVVYVHMDMFDEKAWLKLIEEHGKKNSKYPFDVLISNPPFGKVSKSDFSRDWLKYKGVEMDIAALEIGLKFAEYPSYILPQGSCTFEYSGAYYYKEKENRKIKQLIKETGQNIYMSCASVDTSIYKENFKNTKVTVECVTLQRLDLEGNEI